MDYSIEDYLKNIIPYLDRALVPLEALSKIQNISKTLPLSSTSGFECRLGESQSRVDFQVSLSCFNPNFPESLLKNPQWKFFQEFCDEWVENSSLLHQLVKRVGLEFDLNEESSKIPSPCIFLAFKDFHQANPTDDNLIDAEQLIYLASRLLDRQISPTLRSNLKLCVNSLPNDAYISHLGVMLSRSIEGIRINVREIPVEQISDYLRPIGWIEPTNEFSQLISQVSEFTDSIMLSFDIGEIIYPKIGLECFLYKQPQDNEPRWELFLDFLVKNQLCTPVKRDALLTWSGFSQKHNAPELWPNNISLVDRLFAAKAASIFFRLISHIKLVYQPSRILEAKGYLAFGHYWMGINSVKQQDELQTI